MSHDVTGNACYGTDACHSTPIVTLLFAPTVVTTVMSETMRTNDLQNEPTTVGFRVTDNNERVRLYPNAGETELGVIRHDYDGLPARGTILHDVVGYEIVDYTFEELHSFDTAEEEYEYCKGEICEWIDKALFDTSLSSADCNTYREGTHEWRVAHPYEGDEFVIHLHTTNKRRIR